MLPRADWARSAVGVALITGAYSAVALIPLGPAATADTALTIACAAVMAVALVTAGQVVRAGARAHFAIWFCLLFLNLASVAIEGTLFAPGAAAPAWLGANLLRLAAVCALIAGLMAALYRSQGGGIPATAGTPRHLSGWVWRLALAAGVYVAVYLVLGGINYTLVTRPYYEAHASSLTVPPVATILLYEPIRGLLIAFSVLPLILAFQRRTRAAGLVAGAMLFVVGGLVPLLPQASLPLYLRVASLWEIFGQNVITGIACAYLFLGPRRTARARPTRETVQRHGS